jgi:hypothetical protein
MTERDTLGFRSTIECPVSDVLFGVPAKLMDVCVPLGCVNVGNGVVVGSEAAKPMAHVNARRRPTNKSGPSVHLVTDVSSLDTRSPSR